MDPDALREQLVLLHQELGLARQVDPRSVQLLGEIMEDIKRLLERPPQAAAQPAAASAHTPARSPTGSLAGSAQGSATGSQAGSPKDPRIGSPAGSRTLPDRLEQIAVQFEVDHPTLAASSRRLVDMLGKAGL